MDFFKQLTDMIMHFNYRDIYYQKVSKAISGAVALFFMLFLLFSTKLYFDFNSGFNEFEKTMQNTPYFTIKNGEFNIDAPQPYYPVPGEDSIVIDTTGKTNISSLENREYALLITKTKAYVVNSAYETRTFDLKLINEMSNISNVTRNDITSWIMNFKAPIYIMALLVICIYQLIAKGFSALFLSLILLVASAAVKKNIRYGILFAISVYSLIVPAVFDWVISLIAVPIPFFSLVYWTIAITYGIMGVKKYMEPILPDMIMP